MNLKESLTKMLRLLFFKISREEILAFNRSDLVTGIVFTWLAGIGRYWDAPSAKLLQYLGVGSLLYIFALTFLIWLLFKPFQIKDWSYQNLLTFISLTSAPALLYAIPVERFLSLKLSITINAYFLLAVAAWRVALLIFYLRRFANLSRIETAIASLLPLSLIVTSLTILNLERAVFDIMGGLKDQTSNDGAYAILYLLTTLSALIIIPVILGYLIIIYQKYRSKKKFTP